MSRAVVSIPTTAPGEFYVGRAELHTAFATMLGLLHRFTSAETSIDRRYRFLGTNAEFMQAVFGDPGNLDCVRMLVCAGFTELQKDSRRLVAFSEASKGLPGVEALKSTVALLAGLKLPSALSHPGPGAARRLAARLAMYAVRAATVVLLYFAREYLLTSPAQLLEGTGDIFLTAVLLCSATVAAVLWSLKGQMRALWGSVEVMCFYVLLLVPGYSGTLALANTRFDASAAVQHEVRQVTLEKRQGKRRVDYLLMFDSLPGHGLVTFDVYISDAEFARLRKGDRDRVWLVRVRKGWLGKPWIESIVPRR